MIDNKRKYLSITSYISEKNGNQKQKQIDILKNYLYDRKEKDTNFIVYWGAGQKKEKTKEDLETLIFLFGALKIIERTYQTYCNLTVIFTDTHAYLNGYEMNNVYSYFKDLKYAISVQNYHHILMSELIRPYCNKYGYQNIFKIIDDIISKSNKGEIDKIEEIKSQCGFDKLLKSASKNCKRLIKPEPEHIPFISTEAAAIAYASLNLFERSKLEKLFAESIFITYGSTEEDFILPDLPKFRLFTIRKGIRSRPWFCNSK